MFIISSYNKPHTCNVGLLGVQLKLCSFPKRILYCSGYLTLKRQRHDDFAVLDQFWAKIITLRLYSLRWLDSLKLAIFATNFQTILHLKTVFCLQQEVTGVLNFILPRAVVHS